MIVSVVCILEEGCLNLANAKAFKTDDEAQAYMTEYFDNWVSSHDNATTSKMENYLNAFTDDESITISLSYNEI